MRHTTLLCTLIAILLLPLSALGQSFHTLYVDDQGIIFQAINHAYYGMSVKDGPTDEEYESYKKICPFGVIKILKGNLSSKGIAMYRSDNKVLGCDTKEEYEKKESDGTYNVYRTMQIPGGVWEHVEEVYWDD